MHTLRQIEGTLQQELAEQRLCLDRKVEDCIHSCEASIVQVEERFEPQFQELRRELHEALAQLPLARLEAAIGGCAADGEAAWGRLGRELQALNVEIFDMHAQLPPLRKNLEEQAKVLLRLQEDLPARLQEEVAGLRRELADSLVDRSLLRGLRSSAETTRVLARGQGDAAEDVGEGARLVLRQLQNRIDDVAGMASAVDDRAQQQANTAMGAVSLVEQQLTVLVDNLRHDIERSGRSSKQAVEELRTELRQGQQLVDRSLEGCHGRLEARAASYEAELRDFRASTEDRLAAMERSFVAQVTNLSEAFTRGFAAAQRERQAQAQAQEAATATADDRHCQMLDRLKQVSGEAQSLVEGAKQTMAAQLEAASTKLSDGIAGAREAARLDLERAREDLEKQVLLAREHGETAAASVSAEVGRRVEQLEIATECLRSWSDRHVGELNARCAAAVAETSDGWHRARRELTALGGELARVRAGATSLTQGVLSLAEVVGVLGELPLPKTQRRRGDLGGSLPRFVRVDVEDLLEWDRVGKSLADVLLDQWHSWAKAGAPHLLALLERKVEHEDMQMVRSLLGSPKRAMPASPEARELRATPSTAATAPGRASGLGPSPSPDALGGESPGPLWA